MPTFDEYRERGDWMGAKSMLVYYEEQMQEAQDEANTQEVISAELGSALAALVIADEIGEWDERDQAKGNAVSLLNKLYPGWRERKGE